MKILGWGLLILLLCLSLTIPYLFIFKQEILLNFFSPPKSIYASNSKIGPSNPSFIFEPLPEKVKEQEETLYNKDYYYAICEKMNTNVKDLVFTGCNKCPSYLKASNPNESFEFLYSIEGHFSSREMSERLMFFKGCDKDEFNKGTMILVQHVYTSFERVSFHSDIHFEKKPLLFSDQKGLHFIVGKRVDDLKSSQTLTNSLLSYGFEIFDLKKQIIFSVPNYYGIACYNYPEGRFDPPSYYYKPPNPTILGFFTNLEVVNSQNPVRLEACRKVRNFQIKSGNYKLFFKVEDREITPFESTSEIMTFMEKSFEY
jgi:hypothetical protein